MALKLYELLGDDDRRFSPYCWRIRMALAHKELEAEIIPCRFTDKAPFAFSGQDRVPVLRDGEAAIADSWDIACYLEDTWPDRPSLFGGAVGRGEARFINEWLPILNRPVLLTVLKDIFDHCHPDDRAYFRNSREKRFGKTLEELHAERERPTAPPSRRPWRRCARCWRSSPISAAMRRRSAITSCSASSSGCASSARCGWWSRAMRSMTGARGCSISMTASAAA